MPFNDWLSVILLAVVLLVALGVAGTIGVGLFQARSLIRREFFAYFLSPIAYVVLVVFLAVTGYLFTLTLNQLTASGPRGVEFPLQFMIGDQQWLFWLVFLVIPPLLTMRLFAEERGSGTLEMLMTAPLRDWQLVLSKYVACFAFYALMWIPTLVYLPILVDADVARGPEFQSAWTPRSLTMVAGLAAVLVGVVIALFPGSTASRLAAIVLVSSGLAAALAGGLLHYRHDQAYLVQWPARIGSGPMPVVATYLGLALAGGMFLALGLLISSLVRNQLVAALLSLAASIVFIVTGFSLPYIDAASPLYDALAFISVPTHFSRDFCRGLIDTRHLVLYASVALFALFLTVRSLEYRRWR